MVYRMERPAQTLCVCVCMERSVVVCGLWVSVARGGEGGGEGRAKETRGKRALKLAQMYDDVCERIYMQIWSKPKQGPRE
jgi:hypothetical protein